MSEKHTEEDLRAIIARCCQEADAASEVALQALRAVERQAKRTRDQMRELRGRMAVLEAILRVGRAR